jgi:Na+(H+)/acetate symporter ActP
MDWSTAALLLLALVFANLPFFTERIFFVKHAAGGGKALGWRLFELAVLYAITGAVAWLMESRVGQVHPQNWEFYAITVCLFLVFAYPGFVWRYLWRKPGL